MPSASLLLTLTLMVPPAHQELSLPTVSDPRVQMVQELEAILSLLPTNERDDTLQEVAILYAELWQEERAFAAAERIMDPNERSSTYVQIAKKLATNQQVDSVIKALELAMEGQESEYTDMAWMQMVIEIADLGNIEAGKRLAPYVREPMMHAAALLYLSLQSAKHSQRKESVELARKSQRILETLKQIPDEQLIAFQMLAAVFAGDREAARKYVFQLWEISETDFPAEEMLGELLRYVAQAGEGEYALDLVEELQFQNPEALCETQEIILAELIQQGEIERVLQFLHSRELEESRSQQLMIKLVEYEINRGNPYRAQHLLQRISDPAKKFDLSLSLARVFHRSGRAAECNWALEHAERFAVQTPRGLDKFTRDSDWDDSPTVFISEDHAVNLAKVAQHYARFGNREAALRTMEQASLLKSQTTRRVPWEMQLLPDLEQKPLLEGLDLDFLDQEEQVTPEKLLEDPIEEEAELVAAEPYHPELQFYLIATQILLGEHQQAKEGIETLWSEGLKELASNMPLPYEGYQCFEMAVVLYVRLGEPDLAVSQVQELHGLPVSMDNLLLEIAAEQARSSKSQHTPRWIRQIQNEETKLSVLHHFLLIRMGQLETEYIPSSSGYNDRFEWENF